MVQITKENGMQHAGVPFAWVEVQYPDKAQWDEAGFYDMVERHLAALREQYRDYVRADVFGQNPYFRYFRKFKKTYPVMMQFESVLLKGPGISALEPCDRRSVSGRTGNACALRDARH